LRRKWRANVPDAGAEATRAERSSIGVWRACRRHQRCQLEGAETSVRLRFMDSTCTSYRLPTIPLWAHPRQNTI